MRKFGILGFLALVGAGIAVTALSVRVGEIGSLEEHEWMGVGA